MRRDLRWWCSLAAFAAAGCSGDSLVNQGDAAPATDRGNPTDVVDAAVDDDVVTVDAVAPDAPDVVTEQDVAAAPDATEAADVADAGEPPPPPLMVTRVEWNLAGTSLGAVQAVTEDTDLTAVYTTQGMRLLVAGAVAAMDDSVRSWRTAITAAAADGTPGAWMLAVDSMSRVYRVRDRATLEDVTARLALGMRDIRSSAQVAPDAVAFGGVGAFAVLRGSDVTVWNDPDFMDLVGGGNRVAAMNATGVKVFDLSTERAVRFNLSGVSGVGLSRAGLLVVTVGNVLYEQNERGELAPRYTHTDPMRTVAVSGENTWLVAGDRLALWDGFRVRAAMDVSVASNARLIPARNGGVWVLEGGVLSRYTLVVDPEDQRWNTTVRPIFATRCTPCHLPGGSAGLDLSTRCAWAINRAAIRTQVVDRMLMPPPPAAMPAQERMAIADYLASLSPEACGGVRDAGAPMDVPRDAVSDVPRDVPTDVRMDAGVDVPRDVPTDVRMDAGVDVPRDVPTDVRMDAGVDVPRDVPTDVRLDAAVDVPRDVPSDVRLDAAVDVPRDVPTDVRTDVPRDTGPVDSGAVSYAQVQAIFDRDCVRCHGSSGALNLAAMVSYGNLVNVAAAGGSCAASGMLRVVPGDPAMSLLYRKVMGTQSCGAQMPRGAAAMSMSDTEIIRRWIAAGAPR